MPRYTFECPECKLHVEYFSTIATYVKDTKPCCHEPMVQTYVGRTEAVVPFPEFVALHAPGGPTTIKSLRDIRRLEKKYEDRNLVWEPGSYDNAHYGEEDAGGRNE